MDFGLENKVAIITGANNPQGIGAATAFTFAGEGAKLEFKFIQFNLVGRDLGRSPGQINKFQFTVVNDE